MDKPTISVLTATYNQSEFVMDCINSVAASKLHPEDIKIEHIVVDDGSTDNTPNLLENIEHIKYYRFEKNRGQSAALNKATDEAVGNYIFVLDSDDVILQRTLYHLYQTLHKSNQHQWAYTDFIRTDQNLEYRIADDYYGWEFQNTTDMLHSIFSGEHFLQHNGMYKKELFNKVGGYDEDMTVTEDLDLFIRFLLAGEAPIYLPIVSHLHRFHRNNISIGHAGEGHLKNLEELKNKYSDQLSHIL